MLEPQRSIQPVEVRMESLLSDINTNNVPVFEGLKRAYELAAEKLQGANPQSNVKEGLKNALESQEANAAYFSALHSSTKPERIHPADANVIAAINGTFGEERNLIHYPFLQRATGTYPSVKYKLGFGNSHWKFLASDLEANLTPDIQGLVYAELMGRQAFVIARETAKSLLDTKVVRSLIPGQEKEFFQRKLIGSEGTKYAEGYALRIFPIINTKAEEIFGEDSTKALGLIRSVIYMETGKMKDSSKETLKDIRTPILQAIGQKNYDQAETILRESILKYPHIFKEQSRDLVGLTQKDIEAYKAAAHNQKEAQAQQRLEENLAKRKAKFAALMEQMDYDSSKETVQNIITHQGEAITWKVLIDLLNGDQLEEQMIGYIGNQSSRTIRYVDISGTIKEREIPTFVLRTYVVNGENAVYISAPGLRAGSLLKIINNSTKLPHPERFAKATNITLQV